MVAAGRVDPWGEPPGSDFGNKLIFWTTCLFNFHYLELLSPYIKSFVANMGRRPLNVGLDEGAANP